MGKEGEPVKQITWAVVLNRILKAVCYTMRYKNSGSQTWTVGKYLDAQNSGLWTRTGPQWGMKMCDSSL